jgi:hypothetical protein
MAPSDPLNGRTVPGSGQLDMWTINNEFWGRGYDFNSYRNTLWYTDAGDSGYFSGGQLAMSDFWGKRPDYPIPPAGPGSYIVVGGNVSAFSGVLSTGTPHPSRVIVCTVASGDSTSNQVNGCTIDGTAMTLAVRMSASASMRSTAIFYLPWPSGTQATFRAALNGTSNGCLLASYPIYPSNPNPISTDFGGTTATSVALSPLNGQDGGYGFVTSHHRNTNITNWSNTLGATITNLYNGNVGGGGTNGVTASFRTGAVSGGVTASWAGSNNGSACAALWGP